MRHPTPLRIVVDGLEEPIDLEPEDVTAPSDASTLPRALPPSREDRAAGVRRYEVTIDGWVLALAVEDRDRAILRERAGQASERAGQTGALVVKAQIPGRVARLWVAEGDTVEAGQRLLAIEAMKMENEVRTPRGGTVEGLKVAVGGSVELGDELLTVR